MSNKPTKFSGTDSELTEIVETAALNGTWEEFDPGLRYKTKDGGILQW